MARAIQVAVNRAAPLGLPALSRAVNPLNIPGDYFHPDRMVKQAASGSAGSRTWHAVPMQRGLQGNPPQKDKSLNPK